MLRFRCCRSCESWLRLPRRAIVTAHGGPRVSIRGGTVAEQRVVLLAGYGGRSSCRVTRDLQVGHLCIVAAANTELLRGRCNPMYVPLVACGNRLAIQDPRAAPMGAQPEFEAHLLLRERV
jgi:hypothetical protein